MRESMRHDSNCRLSCIRPTCAVPAHSHTPYHRRYNCYCGQHRQQQRHCFRSQVQFHFHLQPQQPRRVSPCEQKRGGGEDFSLSSCMHFKGQWLKKKTWQGAPQRPRRTPKVLTGTSGPGWPFCRFVPIILELSPLPEPLPVRGGQHQVRKKERKRKSVDFRELQVPKQPCPEDTAEIGRGKDLDPATRLERPKDRTLFSPSSSRSLPTSCSCCSLCF